jgi:AcrR family transcriptional regulator
LTAVPTRSNQIQRAAAHLFAERGYGATSIDDIGAAAGVSGPAIYWHFPGKQALLAAMLIRISEQLLEGGSACVAAAADAQGALVALVEGQVHFALAQPDLIVVHSRELRQLDEQQAHTVRALQRQYVDVWVVVLRRLYPRVARARATAAVQAVIGLINSTPYTSSLQPRSLSPMLRDMALAALHAVGSEGSST